MRTSSIIRPVHRSSRHRHGSGGARTLLLAAGLLAGAALTTGRAHAQIDPYRLHSSTVGVTDGQFVRLNAYFVESADGRDQLPPGPCRVTLRFLDQRGAVVAESVETLTPNRDIFLDYRPAGLRAGERATVRVVLIGERDASGRAPRLIPTIEVVDVASSRTTIAAPLPL